VVKTLIVLAMWLLVLSPTWFFLIVRYLMSPEGFWQNLVLFGVAGWFLGGIQFIFVILGLAVTCSVLDL